MFSVIIPLYNKTRYIEKCLQSVLDQTFHDFEVIVVNDGSTDDGAKKVSNLINRIPVPCALCPEPRIKLLNQPNSGVSMARNNGSKAAKFDYIAFLDADDWWEPAFLEEMKNLIESFPEAGVYGSSYYLVKNNRKRIAPVGVEKPFNKGIINYCEVYTKTLCMPLWTGAVIMPLKVLKSENGFKPVLKLGEDFDLWIRVALKYPVAFLNKPLANYNQDVELKSRSVGNLHHPENHILWNLDYLSDYELSDPGLKQLLDNLRVYGLFPYFLNTKYRFYAKQELGKVDWEKQPAALKNRYKMPICFLKAERLFMYFGSKLKQWFISSVNFKFLLKQ